MAGLDQPTEGSVFFDGKDVTGVPVRERSVAMVYQQFINYPNLTVYENIASPLRVKGADKATVDREVRRAALRIPSRRRRFGPRLSQPGAPFGRMNSEVLLCLALYPIDFSEKATDRETAPVPRRRE